MPGKGLQDSYLGNIDRAPVDMSKLDTIEKIRDYLERELGVDTFLQVYPIIKECGDDILFIDKIGELKESLKHILPPEVVERLHIQFSTLVFYELEMEKNSSMGRGADASYNHISAAVNVFKDVGMTATFGKFGRK